MSSFMSLVSQSVLSTSAIRCGSARLSSVGSSGVELVDEGCSCDVEGFAGSDNPSLFSFLGCFFYFSFFLAVLLYLFRKAGLLAIQ